jgi:Cys-tRNA(Pro) deacylase
MSKTHPETLATKALKAAKVDFEGHLYDYEEHGGTRVSAEKLGVDEFAVLKTLVMQNEAKEPLIVLMHGTMSVSTKELARAAGCKTIESCAPVVAQRHSGFLVGGTSPFGTKKRMPIFLEQTALALPRIWINGGRRGFLVSMNPQELLRVLSPVLVTVGLEK